MRVTIWGTIIMAMRQPNKNRLPGPVSRAKP